jgi:hypothetical protein
MRDEDEEEVEEGSIDNEELERRRGAQHKVQTLSKSLHLPLWLG